MRPEEAIESQPGFRLDVPLHALLTQSRTAPQGLRPAGDPQIFPDPVFPRRPELLGSADHSENSRPPDKRSWTPGQIYHAMQGWLFPYICSRVISGEPLLRPDVIDKLADAGISTFNVAVDAVDLKPGLPKALVPIRKQFDYLVCKQYGYGYSVFLNINIRRNNLDDIRQLTEIAHHCGIATDYHINESPLLEQGEHFKHASDNVTYISKSDWPAVEGTIQWLTEKQTPATRW
jgi:hypothetical protein